MSYARQAVTRLTLDMGLPDVQKSISVTRGDTNRRLEVTLHDRGEPFALPPTWTAAMTGVLPGGDELYESCEVADGRIIFDFVAAPAVSSEEGVFGVSFDVFDEGGEVVASPKLWVHVTAGARRLRDPDTVDRLTTLQEFVGQINKVNSELSAHTEQIGELEDGVSELLDKITTRGTITIPVSEWTDTLPRLAYVMVDAYTKGTVMLVMPANNTSQVKAREARVRIQAEYQERQICFYRDGDTDPGALTFNYVLLRTNDPEALPCAALVGVDAYGEGSTNTGGVDQAAVEAIVKAIVPGWARESIPPAETDPTISDWAKAKYKPTYTKGEVGLGNVDNVKQYSASNPPPYPVTSVNSKTGAVNLGASDVGADPEGTAQSVANKVAKDLEAYYKKTETYGKDEVNNLISAIPKFAIQPVNSLPTTGISTTTVYLLKDKSDSGDLYTEYIYVNGAWEELGRQKVNLTGYVTESMLTNALKSYALASSVPTTLSQLTGDSTHRTVTDAEKTAWNGKVDSSALNSAVTTAIAQAKDSGEFDGKDGKSAYAYAQDGGYTGTEEEFAEDLAKIGGTGSGEPEMVLSANMFDKSTVTSGYVWYRSSAATTKVAQINSFIALVELRGAGTYRFCIPYNFIGDDAYAKRVPLFKADKSFLKNLTNTYLDTSDPLAYLVEVVISESDINEGAVYLAYDGYEPYLNRLMVVKNMEYPSTYIPYGYIEVSTDSDKAVNVLTGKTAVFLGDSICAGTTVEGEYKGYGWAGLIGEANKMNWTNYGKNGGTITNLESVSSGLWLSKQADKAIAENPTADYVIFEGGCNDADLMKEAGLGAISADYSTFDTTTFSGAFESLVLKLVTAYPNGKIGYIIPQKMYTGFADFTATKHRHRLYFDRAVEICQKWGIPVIDLWHGSTLNPKLSNASTFYTDSQHLTLAGYQKITPMIEAWMKDMYVTGSVHTDSSGSSAVGGSGIDVTAEVGQTIVVKTVDEHGKPTAWESADYQPRTHYSEWVELLPETALPYDEEYMQFLCPVDFEFVEGDIYRVKYNGTEYDCTAYAYTDADIDLTFVVIGNGDMLGLNDTGEPFVAYIDEGMLAVSPYEEATELSLKIEHEQYHKIDKKYYDYGVFYIDVVQADNKTCTTTLTPNQFGEAFNEGKSIIARISTIPDTAGHVYTILLPLVSVGHDKTIVDYGTITFRGFSSLVNIASLQLVSGSSDTPYECLYTPS